VVAVAGGGRAVVVALGPGAEEELARALGEGGELLAIVGDGRRSARIRVKLAAPPADPRGLARSLLSIARFLLEAGALEVEVECGERA
jgi:hypothetical protein